MEFETKETNNDLYAALAKAMAEFEEAALDGKNPHFHSRFSSFRSLLRACRRSLAANGLGISQSIELESNGGRILRTTIFHSSGHAITSIFPIFGQIANMQQAGSATSYARRYGLATALGLASESEEDDGNLVSQPHKDSTTPPHPELTKEHLPWSDDELPFPASPPKDQVISEPQRKRFYAIAKKTGVPDDIIRSWLLQNYGIKSSSEIPKRLYDEICKKVEGLKQ